MTSLLRLHATPGLVSFTLALSACSPAPIQIEIDRDGGKTLAHLSQNWGLIISRRETPCIREIELHAIDATFGDPVWRAQRVGDDSQCTHLATIVIGMPPPGFAQRESLSTPLHGQYRLTVRGIGAGNTTMELPSPTSEKIS